MIDRFTEAELDALNSTAIGRKALRRMREDEAMMAALRAENDRLGAMRFAPQAPEVDALRAENARLREALDGLLEECDTSSHGCY